MSASASHDTSCEPNLTPILDMVFQLITFFMLVINFKSAALDLSLKLPVIGSARPLESQEVKDLMVLNVNETGQLLVFGVPQELSAYLAQEARGTRARLSLEGHSIAPGGDLPTTVVLRADRMAPFHVLHEVMSECQRHGFHKISLRAFNREDGGS